MRFQRLIFAVVLACGVSACAKDKAVTHPAPPLAFVRYVNAVPDTFNMDFRAVDQVSYSMPFVNTAFRALGDGNYQGYQAGSRHIRIFLDPNPPSGVTTVDPAVVSTVMVDTTITLTAGNHYTLLHVGSARNGAAVKERLLIITDALPVQASGTVQFRIINAASVQGAVDVYASATGTTTGTPTASALAFMSASTYISQAPGAIILKMTTPGTQVAVGAAAGYTVQAGTAGTTFADPIYGSGIGGSIFTAFIFDASAAGTVGATFAAPGIVFFPDVQPARTTSP
jgi:Domain of unknown function (DUF4397)